MYLVIIFLLTNPTQTRFGLGSRLVHHRPFVYIYVCIYIYIYIYIHIYIYIYNTMLNFILVSFCTTYIIVTFRARVKVSFRVG